MAVESLSMVCTEDEASGELLGTSHVQKVPKEENPELPERLAVAEITVSDVLVQRSMRKKSSQTMMALLIVCRSAV